MANDPQPAGAFADIIASADTIAAETRGAAAPAAAPPAAAPGAETLAAPDYDGDAADLVALLCDGLTEAHPRLASTYTPDVRSRIASRLARVMAKYEWDLEFMGPELLLAMALTPAVVGTVKIMREDYAADKSQQPRAAPPAAALAPSSSPLPTGSPGAAAAAPEPAPGQLAVPVNAQAVKDVTGDAGANLFKKA